MIAWTTFLAFLLPAVMLAIAPGPGILYVLTRSLAGGRREGILSSLGTFVGGFAHVVGAGLGISVVLARSAMAYQAVRWAGAAYLAFLGIRMLQSAGLEEASIPQDKTSGSPFRQGIVTEVLNPKTALFFLSFLPQFIRPASGGVLAQFLILGTASVALNTTVDVVVALLAGPISRRLLASRQARRRQRRLTAGVLIGLGVYSVAREA